MLIFLHYENVSEDIFDFMIIPIRLTLVNKYKMKKQRTRYILTI